LLGSARQRFRKFAPRDPHKSKSKATTKSKQNEPAPACNMKTTLFQLLLALLAGVAVAATEPVDSTVPHLRRTLLDEDVAGVVAAAAPEGMLEFVGDQAELDAVEDKEDGPDGEHRDLATCRTACVIAGCRQYHYYRRSLYSHLMDCCKLSSGALVTCR
jgi:hypothetical protein